MKNFYQLFCAALFSIVIYAANAQTPAFSFGNTYTNGNSVPLAFQPDIRTQMLIPGNAFAGVPFGQRISKIYFNPYVM